MDILLFAGVLVAGGYYANGGTFEGFQPRNVLTRSKLPDNESLRGKDNIYRSTEVERAEAYVQDKADALAQKINRQTKSIEMDEDAVTSLKMTGDSLDDTFATIPFDVQPNYIPNRGLNIDKLCERKFSENFVPQKSENDPFAFGAPGVDRGTENTWNGPELPTMNEIDYRDKAQKAAIEVLGTQPKNGVPLSDGVRDKPLLEHETRLLPRSSDDLRIKPMTTYENVAYFPDNTVGGFEAPAIMPPRAAKRVESVYKTGSEFHLPTLGHGGSGPRRDEQYDRELKTDKTTDFDAYSIGYGADAPAQSWHTRKIRNTNTKQTYNDLNYSYPTSAFNGTPQRNVRVGPTRKQDLANISDYVGLDGVQDRGFISHEREAPRLTQKETMYIDGSRIGRIEMPYTNPSYDVDDVEIPGPTNKELNLTEKVGLPSVSNSNMLPDHPRSLRPTLKDAVSMNTSGFVRPGGSIVSNQPLPGKETRRVSALRSYKSQAPLIQDYDTGVRVIGNTSRSKQKAFSKNAILPYIDNNENDVLYPSLEKSSEEFAAVRKPRRFLDNTIKDGM